MDLFTNRIHYLISASRKWRGRYLLTITDVLDIARLTNKISELVIGESLLNPPEPLWDAVDDSIYKLVENGDIVWKPFDEAELMPEARNIDMDSLYLNDEEFIFDQKPVRERPRWLSPDQEMAMRLATYANFLPYGRRALLDAKTFIEALKWAVDVSTERRGYALKIQGFLMDLKRENHRRKLSATNKDNGSEV